MKQKEEMQLALKTIGRLSFLFNDDKPLEGFAGPYSILGWTLKGLWLRKMTFKWDDIYGDGALPSCVLRTLNANTR